MKDNKGLVINNRQINYKYDIVETFEAGIELKGTEVKSIRDSLCNLKDSFAIINNNEVISEEQRKILCNGIDVVIGRDC